MFEVEIGGKKYIFDTNREIVFRYSLDNCFVDLLSDKEVEKKTNSEIQEILQDKIKNMKKSDRVKLVEKQQEKSFYYALLKNQPEITPEFAKDLYNKVFEEYGLDGMNEINTAIEELNQNFIQKANENKKKIQIRKF